MLIFIWLSHIENKTKIIERLGELKEVEQKANGEDPIIWAKKFIERPNYELHDIYRALEVISKETELIEAEGLKQYGLSKENRPNPITQMGVFMDGDGFPLAFNVNSGNTNEQTTLKPLEKQIIKDFEPP